MLPSDLETTVHQDDFLKSPKTQKKDQRCFKGSEHVLEIKPKTDGHLINQLLGKLRKFCPD